MSSSLMAFVVVCVMMSSMTMRVVVTVVMSVAVIVMTMVRRCYCLLEIMPPQVCENSVLDVPSEVALL